MTVATSRTGKFGHPPARLRRDARQVGATSARRLSEQLDTRKSRSAPTILNRLRLTTRMRRSRRFFCVWLSFHLRGAEPTGEIFCPTILGSPPNGCGVETVAVFFVVPGGAPDINV